MPTPHLLASSLLQACLAIGADAPADAAPVWVFFAEDRAMPATIADTALSARAVSRRALRRTLPGLFDRHDVPVCAEHADAVAGTGARVRTTSRWLNAVSAMATPAQRAALAALPGVTHLEPVGRGRAGWQDEHAGPPPRAGPRQPTTAPRSTNCGRSISRGSMHGARPARAW